MRDPNSDADKPGVEGKSVRLVEVVGKYGDEVSDDHEGAPSLESMKWAAYAVLDQDDKMLTAYLASDPRLASTSGLPTFSPAWFCRATVWAVTSWAPTTAK